MRTIEIGKFKIGPQSPAFIVAELSGNHNGSIDIALELIRAAHRAGVDAVKLQTYRADTITLNCDSEDFQLPKESPWQSSRTLYQLYDQAHTPWEWHEALFKEARKLGLEIFSSPFDETAVDFLETLNVNLYKVASPEINHIPLLEKIGRTKKPVVLSTGVATKEDLDLAVNTLRASGCEDLIILKCNSAYPAPIEESNLLTIPDYIREYNCLAGFSDHTGDDVAAICAVSLGAKLIEKHFTLESTGETVDSFFSLKSNEFGELVRRIRKAEASMGSVSYDIMPSAKLSLRGRRSLYVSRPISKGDLFSIENIKCVRPSFGMHPRHFSQVLGKVAKKDLEVGERLSLDLIQDPSN